MADDDDNDDNDDEFDELARSPAGMGGPADRESRPRTAADATQLHEAFGRAARQAVSVGVNGAQGPMPPPTTLGGSELAGSADAPAADLEPHCVAWAALHE